MNDKDLIKQFINIREIRKKARRRRYRRSRLDRYRREIEVINNNGGSWRDIAIWLRKERKFKVHPTTVGRALEKWSNKEQDND